MIRLIKHTVKATLQRLGYDVLKQKSRYRFPESSFSSHYYQRHTRRRLEHLASLGLAIAGKTVLEVGAGSGDHTDFFVDRGCQVVSTEAREEGVQELRYRYPTLQCFKLDLEHPPTDFNQTFDIIYCYGTLYHLRNPAEALSFLSKCCSDTLLLSSCVTYGEESAVTLVQEDAAMELHSVSGTGCRPTRRWIYEELKKHFAHVYMPLTQPNHPEFPVNWSEPDNQPLPTAVFIASRKPIDNPLLVEEIPVKQRRH